MGGSGPHEGRVEIYYLGYWGTVCYRNWDINDTAVVCRQLGYPSAVDATKRFGQGVGVIWLDGVRCNGSETNLTQCSSNSLGVHSCSHYNDAGATCSGKMSLNLLCLL